MDIELFKECQEAIGEDEYKAIVEERNFRVKVTSVYDDDRMFRMESSF